MKDMADVKRERLITDELVRLGIDAGCRGFHYVRCAVGVCMEILAKKEIPSWTKEVYPTVAKEYNTTASRVERAIRHIVDKAFLETDSDNLYEMFGNTISVNSGKLPNSSFINRVADECLLLEAEEKILK